MRKKETLDRYRIAFMEGERETTICTFYWSDEARGDGWWDEDFDQDARVWGWVIDEYCQKHVPMESFTARGMRFHVFVEQVEVEDE